MNHALFASRGAMFLSETNFVVMENVPMTDIMDFDKAQSARIDRILNRIKKKDR